MKWKFALMVINPDSPFNGGYFRVSFAYSALLATCPGALLEYECIAHTHVRTRPR